MAKIKLGSMPKTFKKLVKFPMLDGTEGSIECVYKYRTRAAFAAFLDERRAAEAAALKDAEDGQATVVESMAKSADHSSDYLLAVLESWNLDVELSRDSLKQLADEVPGAITEMVEVYRRACVEGRLGN